MKVMEETIEELRKNPATEHALKNILRRIGLTVPEGIECKNLPDNIDLRYPVVLKVSDEKILHKTDIGGVKTGIRNREELQSEFKKMKDKFPESSFLIEEMIEGGIEIIVGLIKDKSFGLSIMVGMGGINTEIYGDVTFRLIPIEPRDAEEMIDEVSIGKFTGSGFRGKYVDRDNLVNFLMKISEIGSLSDDFLEQLDLNPVKINGKDIYVLDAKLIKT
ncbi:MAG: acetate--CoA ligase family protein [Thermoplasmataceae archaeon]